MSGRSSKWMLASGLLALGLALASGASGAPAGANATRSGAASTGYARAGHFAPGRGPVDLLVDGKVAAKGLTYRHVTGYLPLSAGTHAFVLRTTAGQNVLSVRAGVPANGAVTVGAVSTRTGLAGNVFDDHLQTPKAGTSLVRFIHTAPAAQSVDIAVTGGPVLARGLSYPKATAYQSVAAGTYDLEVRSATTHQLLLRITRWTASSGSQSSVVLVKTPAGQIDAVPFTDSAGAPTRPKGGPATGLGGTAVDPAVHAGWSTTRSTSTLAILVLALTGLAGVLTYRRPLVG